MLIDERYNFTVLHPPKTAGTWLMRLFNTYIPSTYYLTWSGAKWYIREDLVDYFSIKNDQTWAEISHLSPDKLSREFLFSTNIVLPIRHPIDRFVSLLAQIETIHKREAQFDIVFDTFYNKNQSMGDQIEFLDKNNIPYRVLRQENMTYDLINFLEDFKVPIGNRFYNDIVNMGVTNFMTQKFEKINNNSEYTTLDAQKRFLKRKDIVDQIYKREEYLMKKHYE